MTRLVTDYLEVTAKKFADKIVFADEKREMTFAQLQSKAKKIASKIISMNIFKSPIVIFIEKSPECVAGFLGAAYSGNFYTPIDVHMPISRIEKIMETLNPKIIITMQKYMTTIQQFAGTAEVLLYDELMKENILEKQIEVIQNKIVDTDVLYVLFTSGSTGTPKGVIISHRAVIDYIEWFSDEFAIDEQHIFGNQAPLYFDLSIQDVYVPLKTGCTVYLLNQEIFAFPLKIMEYMEKKRINIIVWVPSALCLIANLKALAGKFHPPLQKICFCGEVMPTKQLNQWKMRYPEALFVNMYGPTEAAVACTYYVVNRDFSNTEFLPIGIPCRNMDIIVLNEVNVPVKGTEIGELCIRGTGLALGYFNAPEKTAEVFVQNPLNLCYPERIYRTGDLVHYNEFGELMYDSRKDFQIKHMGRRIELGEIETMAGSVEGVERCCAVYDDKRKKIVLYYCGQSKEDILKAELGLLISEYMMPNTYVRLEEMPQNLNGKIDRVKLKGMLWR